MADPDKLRDFMQDVFGLKEERASHAEKEIKTTCSNGNASMVAAVSAIYAAWCAFASRSPIEPVSSQGPALTNLLVSSHLVWLCNTALGVKTLVSRGLEPQARVLTRTLAEATYQTLVLFHDPSHYADYLKGYDVSSSKAVYYDLFSKKQRLQKKLQRLEDEFKTTTLEERSDQFKQRVAMLEHYSQATHSSAMHVLRSSFRKTGESSLETTILGMPTPESQNTLLNCSHELCYFCMLFDHVIKRTWKLDIEQDENYQIFLDLFKLAATFRTHRVGTGSPATTGSNAE